MATHTLHERWLSSPPAPRAASAGSVAANWLRRGASSSTAAARMAGKPFSTRSAPWAAGVLCHRRRAQPRRHAGRGRRGRAALAVWASWCPTRAATTTRRSPEVRGLFLGIDLERVTRFVGEALAAEPMVVQAAVLQHARRRQRGLRHLGGRAQPHAGQTATPASGGSPRLASRLFKDLRARAHPRQLRL